MSGITLNATQRSSLLSLTQVSTLFNQTQNRLNTGKKINSATDGATAFFQAQSLSDRAGDILGRKNVTDQSIQAVQTALTATSAVTALLKQLQGVLSGARGALTNQRVAATQQFKDIGAQLTQLVKDASFQGLNILSSTGSTLSTQFSERTAATFTIKGFNLAATGTGGTRTLFTQAANVFGVGGTLLFSALVADNTTNNATGFSNLDTVAGTTLQGTVKASIANAIFTATDNRISNAINQLRGISSQLGTNVAILQSRSDFSANYSNSLQSGSDKLTLADLNTEAANSQALTLRQQFGVQSLVSASQQNQTVLTILRG
jgi:flagellin